MHIYIYTYVYDVYIYIYIYAWRILFLHHGETNYIFRFIMVNEYEWICAWLTTMEISMAINFHLLLGGSC